jgi:hypothetical protein
MTSIRFFNSPWINWVAIIHETDEVVIAEIDLNADGKCQQPLAYMAGEFKSFIYFAKGSVEFSDLPFEYSLTFAETVSGSCHVCIMKRPEDTAKYRFFDRSHHEFKTE